MNILRKIVLETMVPQRVSWVPLHLLSVYAHRSVLAMSTPPPSPRTSPSVAVDLHGLSRGVLFALMEARTPFQGHTSVFMPDLRESQPKVLGVTVSGPCHRSGQGTHCPAGAWQTWAPISSDPPSSAEDTLTPLCPHTLLGARVLRPRRAHSLSPSNSRQRISPKEIRVMDKA